jgi:hypothetical protein
MVTFEAELLGRPVRVEVHGPHDLRGTSHDDALLIGTAVRLINHGVPVYGGILLGGGIASFEDERIAVATLAEVCDDGTVSFDGLDLSVPDGAIA